VGVNAFVDAAAPALDVLRVSDEADVVQRGRLAGMRARRDQRRVEDALAALRGAADQDINVIPAMLDCARAYCTLYEIRHALEEVYGAYREPVFF
jgi:methylmalonyl-CoA mutase N-terminal domain/subunit